MILYNFRRKFLFNRVVVAIAYSKKSNYIVWKGFAINIPEYYLNENVVAIMGHTISGEPMIYIVLKENYK